jgi:Arc/MetJ family transcription regulator
MSRTTIDLDDELLARASKELGTTSKKDTIHAALRAALRKSASRALLDRLAQSTEADEDAVNEMWEQPGDAASARGVDEQAKR